MRILILTHSFNSLTQRLHRELESMGHELSVEFDIAEGVTEEALALFRPHLVVAPFLKRRIPDSVWRAVPCFIVHPGPPGDRGPSALDWALQEGEARWGVTVLQAVEELDAGPVWASRDFPMRVAPKSSLYRFEVTEAAWAALQEALTRFESGLRPDAKGIPGRWRPAMGQEVRQLDWGQDSPELLLRKLHAADGSPGVRDALFGEPCHLFEAQLDADPPGGRPGEVVGWRETALRVATREGGLWIGQVRRPGGLKLPATLAFGDRLKGVPELPLEGWWRSAHPTWQDLWYEEEGPVGFLHFEFPQGALSTGQCQRLREAYLWATGRPTRVIVLRGGRDFWCNGIHLKVIEASPSAADASWANIQAMDDLAEAILRTRSHLTVAALGANAGAGGCFLARAVDEVWLREGVIVNPHYKNMGNLYGSEFWTYLLPKRLGPEGAKDLMARRLPLSAREAVACGLYDAVLPGETRDYSAALRGRAAALAGEGFQDRLAEKLRFRDVDEAERPLEAYRKAELAAMHRNFYGFDPSYHIARSNFIHRVPHSWTPRHLARHRELGWNPETLG